MKRATLGLVGVVFLWHATVADASTITAATCGNVDVAQAINSAGDGDTVAIPAGQCTWTTGVTTSKRLTLRGAGAGQTIITDGVDKDIGSPPQALVWTAPDTGPSRMTGIEWHGSGGSHAGIGNINIRGTSSQFRMDHNKFVPDGTAAVYIYGYVRGVVDHNTFDISANNGFGIYVHHHTWNIPGSDFGDASFAAPDTLGTDQAMFVEDNLFTNDQSAFGTNWANDGWQGSRVVYRYNTYVNTLWANHGTDTGGRWRSQRQFEIYNNTFFLTVAFPAFIGMRGGTGVIFNNTGTLSGGGFIQRFSDINNYRSDDPRDVVPFHLCTGSNVWDGNTDSTGYPCLDQPGRGMGGLLSAQDPVPIGWPNQALAPIYIWNNTVNASKPEVVSQSVSVVEGRDYFNSAKPGYVPYTYPHPLIALTELQPNPPSAINVSQQFAPIPASGLIMSSSASVTAVNTSSEVSMFQFLIGPGLTATSSSQGAVVSPTYTGASSSGMTTPVLWTAPAPLHFRAIGLLAGGAGTSLAIGVNLNDGIAPPSSGGGTATVNLNNNIIGAIAGPGTLARLDVYVVPLATRTAPPNSANNAFLASRFAYVNASGTETVVNSSVVAGVNFASPTRLNVLARWSAADSGSSLTFFNRALKVAE